MQEIWKTTDRLKGFYEVSNLGRVRRTAGVTAGKIRRLHKGYWGYYSIILCFSKNQHIQVPVHRLVCEAFNGPSLLGQEVNHKNHDKTDNRPENLEWVSKSENLIHDYRCGTRTPNRKKIAESLKHYYQDHPPSRGAAKLAKGDVPKIRAQLRKGMTGRQIAINFGVHEATISDIKIGKTWSHVA